MQKNNKFAPIVIFTYNRLNDLKQVINSLLENKDVKQTELIIYSDGFNNFEGMEKVQSLRDYLYTIKGFQNTTIIEREKNYGLAKNIIEGVSEVIGQYGKAIVLEDDLLTSENFLTYMNQALNFYEKNEKVFAISGYTSQLPSLDKLEDDVYFSYRPSSWGWATWKDRWDGIDWSVEDFEEFIQNRQVARKFNRGGIDMTRMLKHCMQGKNHSWAIRWSYAMFKQDKYCVYPKVSKIQNIGFGDDATNCTGIDIYQTNLDNGEQVKFKFSRDIKIDNQIAKEFRYTFSYTNKALKRVQNYLSRFKK